MSNVLTDNLNDELLQHLDKGGILLWVNLADAGREQQALEIMNRHAAQPVEVHEVPQSGSEG
ncbi:hypothetical protein [Azospirillum brasilense]|uniref:hypothetical protein n=1 Tax=Azospirillum brasilense TaxID=192 RepID=UPI00157B682B|nr:hypothetical protein [Azospirillum brasilense]NUB31889.1 hypothetical protein [Azospirillum brasilense]